MAQLNLRKSCVWSPGACDAGTSGISRSSVVPLVLKQPLLIPRVDDSGQHQALDTDSIDKIARSRRALLDRLQDLMASGLSTQHAVCLARTVLGGDSVYLQQCRPLSHAQAEHLDNICLDGLLGLLDIEAIENAELGVAARRRGIIECSIELNQR